MQFQTKGALVFQGLSIANTASLYRVDRCTRDRIRKSYYLPSLSVPLMLYIYRTYVADVHFGLEFFLLCAGAEERRWARGREWARTVPPA